ncbi:hypothetical protein M5689_008200 [Euphorbia peplus]|nr:hypothetical protein M5689_008200 [Euphorbia peplus]
MAEEEEEASDQTKPFAPASIFKPRSDADEEKALSATNFNFRHRNCLKICGCTTAFISILAVAILILSFTVFHVKHPTININKIILSPIDNGSQSTTHLAFVADVSVKNPNVAPFKFGNGTTTVFHGGDVIGRGVSPAGVAKAWQTVEVNVTGNVSRWQINSATTLKMESSSVIGGKVKISKMIKKDYRVEINCSIVYDLESREIQHICRSHFI